MVELGRVARVTRSGQPHAGKGPETVQEQAWMLYARVRAACDSDRSARPMKNKDHVDGYRYEGSLKRHLVALYPESQDYHPDKYATFERAIYSHLRATNNAVCLAPSARPPVWWIRKEWNDVTTVLIPVGSSTHRDELEAKVTPHEAGEDREPAPVEVRPAAVAVEEPPGQPALPSGIKLPERTSDEMQQRVLLLMRHLARAEEPLTAIELSHVMDDVRVITVNETGHIAPEGETKRVAGGRTMGAIKVALTAGLIKDRLETVAERKVRAGFTGEGTFPAGRLARLYWLREPIPPRTKRDLVGFTLQTSIMPTDAGAKTGARLREERNNAVLEAICNLKEPANIRQLAEIVKTSRGRVEDAVKDLLEAELVHYETAGGVRYFLPVDKPFPEAPDEVEPSETITVVEPEAVPEPEPVPIVAHPVEPQLDWDVMTRAERVSLRWAMSQREPFTVVDGAEATGYSQSVINGTIFKHKDLFLRVGSRKRHRLYTYVGQQAPQEEKPMDATPTQAPAAPVPAQAAPAPAPAAAPAGLGAALEGMVQQLVAQEVARQTASMRDALTQIAKIAGDATR